MVVSLFLGCLCLVSLYIVSGAAVIAEAQNWSYLDAMYYCFISLFTIGFGGIRLNQESTLWICALYLLFGVTLLSTCCHILHQEVTSNLKKYRSVKRRNRLLLTEIEANKVDNTSWPEENHSSPVIQVSKDTKRKIRTTFFIDYCVLILVPNSFARHAQRLLGTKQIASFEFWKLCNNRNLCNFGNRINYGDLTSKLKITLVWLGNDKYLRLFVELFRAHCWSLSSSMKNKCSYVHCKSTFSLFWKPTNWSLCFGNLPI